MNTRRIRTFSMLAGLLLSMPADARFDGAGRGSGRDGSLQVSAPETIVNHYAALVSGAQAGASSVRVDSPGGFGAGDLVLVWQTAGREPRSSGAGSPIDPTALEVGRWTLERVTRVQSDRLHLAAPLADGFPAGHTQVVRVPEYEAVSIEAGGAIVAAPWNGRTGGIVAFFVDGVLYNDGLVSATGAGYRGGETVRGDGSRGCEDLDTGVPHGAWKGEGIAGDGYGEHRAGRGNLGSGGGGGVCRSSGGGGGAHAGRGGLGGRSASRADGSRDVGGLGGAPLRYSILARLIPGGGGGGGHGKDGQSTAGGSGGGVVLVRAASVTGSGTFEARGQTPPAPPSAGMDGQGGGGAGGSISLRVSGEARCGAVVAAGGDGGSTPGDGVGPGGGGGGGQVLLQASGGACDIDVSSGVAGVQSAGAPHGAHYGAGPDSPHAEGHMGIVEMAPPGGLPVLASPRFDTPAAGEGVNDPRPTITGLAAPETEVAVVLDGLEVARVEAAADGIFSWSPPFDLEEGRHVLRGRSLDAIQYVSSDWSADHVFYVGEVIEEPDPPDPGAIDPASPVHVDVAEVEACISGGVHALVSVTPFDDTGAPVPEADVRLEGPWPYVVAEAVGTTQDPDSGAFSHHLAVGATRCTPGADVPFTVVVDGVILDATPALTFLCPPVDSEAVEIVVDPPVLPAGGTLPASAMVHLMDTCGTPAFDRPVEIRPVGDAVVKVSPETAYTADRPGEDRDGAALFELSAETVGRVDLEVVVDGEVVARLPDGLTVIVPPAELSVRLVSGVVSAVPGQTLNLLARVENTGGVPVSSARLSMRQSGLVDLTGPLDLEALAPGESVEAILAVQVALGATEAWARLVVTHDDGAGGRITALSEPIRLVIVAGGGTHPLGFECSGAGGGGGGAVLVLGLGLIAFCQRTPPRRGSPG